MNYKPLYLEEDFISVVINWSNPFLLEQIKTKSIANHEQGYFYKLLGRKNDEYELFYIGQTQSQYISKRLINVDHKNKQERFRKDYPNHELCVSVGTIESPNKIKATLINNVESLLIFSCYNDDFKHFGNIKSTLTHKVIRNYKIVNDGFKQDGMYKEIAFGLFYK